MKALKLFSFLLSPGWPRGYLFFSGSSLSPRSLLCTTAEYRSEAKVAALADWPGCDDISVSFSWTTSIFAFYHAPNILWILFESLPHHPLPPTRLKQHSGGILAADMHLKAVNSSLMKQYVNIWKIARRAYQTNLFPIYSPQWDNFSHTLYRQCGRSLP